jgi:hypothetical protein
MTKQFFGITPWFALIALLISGCQSAPAAGAVTPSALSEMAE